MSYLIAFALIYYGLKVFFLKGDDINKHRIYGGSAIIIAILMIATNFKYDVEMIAILLSLFIGSMIIKKIKGD